SYGPRHLLRPVRLGQTAQGEAQLPGFLHLHRRCPRRTAADRPQSIRKLIDAGWLAIHRPTKKATLTISFLNPQLALERAPVRRAQRRVEKTKAVGETLWREYLDIVVEDAEYKDDYAPPALTNPRANERLDFERYYAKRNIAIEFNGP